MANDALSLKPSFGPVLFEAAGEELEDCLVSPCLTQMYDFWRRNHSGGGLPNQTCIDPVAFFPWLPNIMLVDLESEDERLYCRVRLNGELHISIAGQNMSGRRFDEIPTVRNDEGSVVDVFLNVAESREPHYWRRQYINPRMPWNAYERCLLPFVDESGAVRSLMAVAQVLMEET
ncbi:PAS domain-containing protein [Hwanghaeella grinnelliae]|uniref:PAS domain-containing protein n=1 Tax=Hwanghaeella grinnelliae TaxID=2500179 RepID=A0A437QWS0_9PROT|nr:PAS domain-containing protein [Hwanghaeella grinnelliae]RVU38972.1 PAS domain-containing protein [Hwanghaeella grinnelliae]